MCRPDCRDPRPAAEGVARKVADALDRQGIPPAAMSAYLRDVDNVDRFAELCYSHASGTLDGLTKGILADDVRAYVVEPHAPR